MATLRALTQKVRSKLKSLGRTAATKNVMEALDKISAQNGDNNLGTENWKNFITAFNQVKFTLMRDKDVTLLITALFSAIVRSGCSKLTVPASQTTAKKSYPGKRKKGDKNSPKIDLGQALINGDGVAAKKILDKTKFGNVLKNMTTNAAGLQEGDITKFSNNITKFLNRVGKITSMWRHLPGSKKALGIVRDAFEAMTDVEYKLSENTPQKGEDKKGADKKPQQRQRQGKRHLFETIVRTLDEQLEKASEYGKQVDETLEKLKTARSMANTTDALLDSLGNTWSMGSSLYFLCENLRSIEGELSELNKTKNKLVKGKSLVSKKINEILRLLLEKSQKSVNIAEAKKNAEDEKNLLKDKTINQELVEKALKESSVRSRSDYFKAIGIQCREIYRNCGMISGSSSGLFGVLELTVYLLASKCELLSAKYNLTKFNEEQEDEYEMSKLLIADAAQLIADAAENLDGKLSQELAKVQP